MAGGAHPTLAYERFGLQLWFWPWPSLRNFAWVITFSELFRIGARFDKGRSERSCLFGSSDNKRECNAWNLVFDLGFLCRIDHAREGQPLPPQVDVKVS
jgi:hypothetical protein